MFQEPASFKEAATKDHDFAELEREERRLRKLVENTSDIVEVIDAEGRIRFASSACKSLLGYEPEELVGINAFDLVHPDDLDRVVRMFEKALETNGAEFRLRHKDGQWRFFDILARNLLDDPDIEGFVVNIRDVTARRRAEELLNKSSERLREAHRIANLGDWEFDAASKMFRTYGELYRDFDFDRGQSGIPADDMNRTIHPEDSDRVIAAFERTLTDGAGFDKTYRVMDEKGKILHIHVIGEVTRDDTGKIVGMRGTTQDITALKLSAQELRKTQDRLSAAQRIAGIGSWELDPTRLISTWSEGMFRIFDLDPEIDKAPGRDTFYDYVHPEDVDKLAAAIQGTLDENRPMILEYRLITKLGNEKNVLTFGETEYDDAGNLISFSGTVQDITALRQAEQQLQQAQKMETVGQLSAGVAHDFNNLLAVISGNLELAQDKLPADSDVRHMLEAAFGASQRGADLTGRLLAYSRRQTLTPQPTDINKLTEHVLGLARRTLGEAVEVVFEPAEGAWWAHIDPSQLENALLNLAINARDAMPHGGTLSIRTENVGTKGKRLSTSEALSAGEYLLIEVADTGAGMSEDVREKVFEPFFTTKEVGEGSGLGLSMVYGFVNQSGGHAAIDSTVGEGTVIRLYLPRSEEINQEAPEAQPATLDIGSSGETVLIVEDDPHVREMTVSLVESLGHTILEAADAASALEVIESGTQIDLLLSDVILGKGMNGVELANQVRESFPETNVLLMSGYPREAFAQDNGLGDTYELISKPFRIADLAQKIKDQLH